MLLGLELLMQLVKALVEVNAQARQHFFLSDIQGLRMSLSPAKIYGRCKLYFRGYMQGLRYDDIVFSDNIGHI